MTGRIVNITGRWSDWKEHENYTYLHILCLL
jgi:hypothetical protein